MRKEEVLARRVDLAIDETKNLYDERDILELEKIPTEGDIIYGRKVDSVITLEIYHGYSGAIYSLDGNLIRYYDLVEPEQCGVYIGCDYIEIVRTDSSDWFWGDVVIMDTEDGDIMVGILKE